MAQNRGSKKERVKRRRKGQRKTGGSVDVQGSTSRGSRDLDTGFRPDHEEQAWDQATRPEWSLYSGLPPRTASELEGVPEPDWVTIVLVRSLHWDGELLGAVRKFAPELYWKCHDLAWRMCEPRRIRLRDWRDYANGWVVIVPHESGDADLARVYTERAYVQLQERASLWRKVHDVALVLFALCVVGYAIWAMIYAFSVLLGGNY